MKLLDKSMNELTVKDTLLFTTIVTAVSFAPVAIYFGWNALQEWKEDRRLAKEKEENWYMMIGIILIICGLYLIYSDLKDR